MHEILYSNPFGDHFSLEFDDWADLYKLICNTTASNKRRRNNLAEVYKLSIAAQMRRDHGHMYKYRPQHIIYSELCHVLQKRAFRLDKSGDAHPLAINKFNPRNSEHVLVREIAFGPDSDPAAREVALWFNIPHYEVLECTPQAAKRFRWKKLNKFDDQRAGNKASPFDTRECFVMIRPHDRDAFQLATDILNHRFQTVKAERLPAIRERFDALKTLKKEKGLLKETFQYQRRSWVEWAWPITKGRQSVDDKTPVPPVDVEYAPIIDEDAMSTTLDEAKHPIKGSSIQPVWDSFISHSIQEMNHKKTQRNRLSIFARLGYGTHFNDDRSLPHITKSSVDLFPNSESIHRASERCWKNLLLIQEEKHHCSNEWEIVREHFENSRSKKVLTIIQAQ